MIEVNPLAEIAPESLGVLGVEDGGFGIDMWRGTPRNVIALRRPMHDFPAPIRPTKTIVFIGVTPGAGAGERSRSVRGGGL